jgi:ABC-type transport system involved in multi-copper enzyme maturation permease subunit
MLLSEWTKLRSVRSTPLSLAAAFAIAVLGGYYSAAGRAKDYASWPAVDKAAFDPVNLSFDGLAFAQLAFGVIGVLAISSEYATGQIRTSFTVVPRRRLLLAGKAVVLAAMAVVVGGLTSLVSFLVAQLGLRSAHLNVSLGDGPALRAVAGAAAYLVALTLLGLALGAIIRHTAGAVTTVFGLVFVAPLVAANLSDWISWPSKWNLWAAANALITSRPPADGAPSPGMGLLICAVYVFVPLALAVVLIGRRDA